MKNSVAFLGIAERAACVREGNTHVLKWDVLGLKQVFLSALFPLPLTGTYIGLSFRGVDFGSTLTLRITAQDGGHEIGLLTIAGEQVQVDAETLAFRSHGPIAMLPDHGWATFFLPLGAQIVIPQPGIYLVTVQAGGSEDVIGQLQFEAFNPQPLTADRIAAIRSY